MPFFKYFLTICLSALPLLSQNLVCWFPPGSDASKSKAITDAISKGAGVTVNARVAANYPELLRALGEDKPQLAYVGSFASVIIKVKNLGTSLVQKVDGRELYSGIMVHPKGKDPLEILKNSPTQIAFAVGATSGESSAKAATAGKAAITVKDHMAAANAVKAGKAKAAFVKNFWWADNKDKFPELVMFAVPGVSEPKNPDNILWASKAVPIAEMSKLAAAAKAAKETFGAQDMKSFDARSLSFTQALMKQGSIDPKAYTW
jgi:ABC-type phosphate/phosphonate transport system substrate-binding protein